MVSTLTFIVEHPLCKNRRFKAVLRYFLWQMRSVIVDESRMKFVNNTRIILKRGMHAGTGNVYTGLMEFMEMSFLLHFLRDSDLFVDIGSNIGTYTILASGVCCARSVAIEPIEETCTFLEKNIILNDIGHLVRIINKAVADKKGVVRMTIDEDTKNKVLDDESIVEGRIIECATADEILASDRPALIKMDVEGFEAKVMRGMKDTIKNRHLKAIIIELKGLGIKYGVNETEVRNELHIYGFERVSYDPFTRKLASCDAESKGNELWIRDKEFVQKRLSSALEFTVVGRVL